MNMQPKIQSTIHPGEQLHQSSLMVFITSFMILSLLVVQFSFLFNNHSAKATHNTVSFADAVNYTSSDQGFSFDLATGPVAYDLNEDGHLDIVQTAFTGDALDIFIGNGDGTFDAKVSYPTGDGPAQPTIIDINNDDNVDIIVSDCGATGAVSVFLGNGDGTFDAKVDYSTTADCPYNAPEVVDFNNDNFLDIAVTSSGPTEVIAVLLGNGDGTFDPAVTYPVGGGGGFNLKTGLFNNDAYLDIISINCNGDNITVLINEGDGTFAAGVDYPAGNCPYISALVDDFNHDNELDLIFPNTASSFISVLIGNGDGTFDPKVDYATNGNSSAASSYDFNGDDNLDIVTINNNGVTNTISILMGNGDGTFDAKVDYATGGGTYTFPEIYDFNMDGNADIAVLADGSDNYFSIFLGNGDGTFDAAINTSTGNDANYNSIEVADFNEDGLMDIATLGIAEDRLSIFINNTDIPNIGFSIGSDDGLEDITTPEIPVVLTSAQDNDVTIDYEVSGGTATGSGTDYTLADGTLTIGSGETEGFIPLNIEDDAVVEGSENIEITLSNAHNALLANESRVFTYTILDNDTVDTPNATESSGSKIKDPAIDPNQNDNNICIGYSLTDSCITQSEYTVGISLNPNSTQHHNYQNDLSLPQTFLRNLAFGSIGEDVRQLQIFLNNHNFMVASYGAGSKGKETNYYGNKTKTAITKLQEFYSAQILTPLGLSSGTGNFGDFSRKLVNSLIN